MANSQFPTRASLTLAKPNMHLAMAMAMGNFSQAPFYLVELPRSFRESQPEDRYLFFQPRLLTTRLQGPDAR